MPLPSHTPQKRVVLTRGETGKALTLAELEAYDAHGALIVADRATLTTQNNSDHAAGTTHSLAPRRAAGAHRRGEARGARRGAMEHFSAPRRRRARRFAPIPRRARARARTTRDPRFLQ